MISFEDIISMGEVEVIKSKGRKRIIKLKGPEKYFENVWLRDDTGNSLVEMFWDIPKSRYRAIEKNQIGFSLEELRNIGSIESIKSKNETEGEGHIVKLKELKKYFESSFTFDEKETLDNERFFEISKERYDMLEEDIGNFSFKQIKDIGTIEETVRENHGMGFDKKIIQLKEPEKYFENKWHHTSHGDPYNERFLEISKERYDLLKQEILERSKIKNKTSV